MASKLPKVNKVAVAYSGGLDSALCVRLLFDKYGAKEVHCVTVNVGLDQDEIEEARSKAEILGVPWTLIEGTHEFANEWIAKAIQANSSYEGYPVATSMTRQLIAQKVAQYAVEHGCDGICEGSTGKGNDQYRMNNVFTIFAPDLAVICPVRDFNLTRAEEKRMSKRYGIPYKEGIGDDRTMWCRSIGSGEVDNLKMQIPAEEYLWYVPPDRAPDEALELDLEFRKGVPVRCDGKRGLAAIIKYLNRAAGAHGVGKIDMIEDGMMGLKSREAYEAPAAEVILTLHRDLEQLCLSKEEVLFKHGIDDRWAQLVYHGAWFHPLKRELDAFIAESQRFVAGRHKIRIYRGNIDILERESEHSLFSPELRSLATKGFDQRDSGPATKIHAIPYRIMAKRGL